jgi:hypothetical protein
VIKPENLTSTAASQMILYPWDDDSFFLGKDERAKNLF